MSGFRAGVVALLGRPNAGKSTLLNHILGEKLAIVTRKPQTTRSRILGIHTREDAQILFVDTPGLHSSEKALNVALNAQVHEAADDCDVALLLVEDVWGDEHQQLAARMRKRGGTTAFRPPTLAVTPHFHRAIRFGESGLGPSEADCLNHQMPLSLSLPQSHLNPEGAMYSHNVDTENALDFHGTPGSA